jgi:hypothetical protein
MTERLLTAAEVAERLSVPESWVRAETRAGRIPHFRSVATGVTTGLRSSPGSRSSAPASGGGIARACPRDLALCTRWS